MSTWQLPFNDTFPLVKFYYCDIHNDITLPESVRFFYGREDGRKVCVSCDGPSAACVSVVVFNVNSMLSNPLSLEAIEVTEETWQLDKNYKDLG